MSVVASDPRQFVKMSVDVIQNPKILSMADPVRAMGLQLYAICYCAASLTDGHFPINALRGFADDTVIKEMIEEGIWHGEDNACERCPQPRKGSLYVHDYLQHQRPASDVREISAKRRAAGAAGLEKRWGKHAEQKAAELQKKIAKGEVKPPRPEVVELCEHLAEWVARNSSNGKKPPITQDWLNEARKLIELDRYPVDKIKNLIDWCQQDSFWAPNVRSMPKFRKQYEVLRARALEQHGKVGKAGGGRRGSGGPTTLNFDGMDDEFAAQAGARKPSEEDTKRG